MQHVTEGMYCVCEPISGTPATYLATGSSASAAAVPDETSNTTVCSISDGSAQLGGGQRCVNRQPDWLPVSCSRTYGSWLRLLRQCSACLMHDTLEYALAPAGTRLPDCCQQQSNVRRLIASRLRGDAYHKEADLP
jgi:hypothetical protein